MRFTLGIVHASMNELRIFKLALMIARDRPLLSIVIEMLKHLLSLDEMKAIQKLYFQGQHSDI